MITRGKWLAGILGVIAVVYQVGARTILALPAWTSLVVVSLVSYALISLHKRETIQPGLKEIHGLHALSFTSTSAWSAHLTRKSWEEKTRSTPLYKLASDKTNSVVDKIFALIKSSFILPWYSRISPSPAFPNAVDILIRQVLVDLVDRSESVDWATLSVSKILPRLTDHVHHFRSVEHLSSTSTPQPKESLPLPLPKNPHPAIARQAHMSSGGQLPPIEAHFRSMVSRVLESVLPESGKSNVVQTMVREVVLGSVLLPCFELLCDADFWNRQFEERGGRYLHEQKQVNKFLSALSTIQSKSDSAAASPVRPRATAVPTSITANSSTSQFEAFIRSISRVKTLGEARRLRADIEREQRVASMGSKQDIPTDLSQEKRAKKYLKRLDRAKLEVDARIASLSRTNPKSYTPASGPIPETIDHGAVNLYVVLTDPSSLAYWLEYMERRFRSKLVQFWLTIEGFKDPLEGIGQLDGTIVTPSNNAPNSHSRQTIGEDLAFLHQVYFAKPDPLLSIPERHVQTVNSMVEAGKSVLDPADIRKAKQAIFASQQAIYEQMEEEDWKGFKKSELYIKAISDLSHSSSVFTKPSPAVEPAPVIQRSQSVFSPKSRPQPKHSSSIPTSTPLHSMPSSPLMARPLPSLLGSYITPSPSVTSASVSVTPPHLEHRKSEVRPPVVRQTSAGGVDMTASTGSLSGPSQPVTPPAARRSKQLGFLIGDETESSVEREKLFGSDDEELLEDDDEDFVQVERMEAIQAALNDIMASDMASSRIIAPDKVEEPLKSPSASMVLLRKTSDTAHAGPSKKTSRSAEDLKAHAVAPPPPKGKRAVSGDKVPGKRNSMSELAKRKESFLFDDDAEDHEANEDEMDEVVGLDKVVHAKLPSDLDLSKEIDRLQSKIQDLIKQGHLLDSLIRQAELTGSQSELKLLRRSEASVRRDQRTAIFQKAQLEQREEERRLVPGRTRVAIPSSVVSSASEDGGKQIVRYTVEITQTEGETPSAVWTVSRRYNDFWDLDRSLREWNSVNGHPGAFSKVAELPPKKLVTSMSSSFVDGRRQGLERYLQSLVALEHFCEARPLKTFLSASSSTANDDVTESSLAPHNLVKSLYKTMTTSLDDAALAPSMLDVMSTTWQRQLSDIGGFLGIGSEELAGFSETYLPQALKPNLQRTDSSIPAAARRDGPSSPIQPLGGESGSGSFTAPICDLLIEVFDLKENNWLRRQAIVVVLQQFLGGTIERKFKDALKSALSEDSLVKGLQAFEEMMWPGGERRPASTPRTDQEKLETRIRAGRNLSLLIPDSAAYMIGRSNARRAARRVFGALQDQRLNQHLMLCIFDEIIGALFPKQVE